MESRKRTNPSGSTARDPSTTAPDDSISTMAQVTAPREFKFVGAYSRKRRRRKVPASKEAPMTPKSPPGRASSDKQNDQTDQITVGTDTMSEPAPMTSEAPPPEPMMHGGHPLLGMLLAQDSADGASGLNVDGSGDAGVMGAGDVVDWADSDGGLMNLFQDLSADYNAPLDPMAMAGQYALPPFFPGSAAGPFNPFGYLGGSPSTDSSARSRPQPDNHHDDDDDEEELRDDMGEDDMALYHAMDDIPLPPPETHSMQSGISHTISQLLTRYDQEFCVLPLTHDFEANPFRFDPKTGRGSQLLLHCILAISYKHIGRETGAYHREAKTHKKTAFRLLKDVEGESSEDPVHANFLDALLILMTLDCATSARGPWIWYLQRAHKMIQATESLGAQNSPRMQARIEMLVWWDVTLALTTRRGCVLSEGTALSLLGPAGSASESSFYGISGCPRDLFIHMVRLASYAREYELAAGMACVRFDMDLVLETARAIRAWQNPRFTAAADEDPLSSPQEEEAAAAEIEQMEVRQYKEDLYHCAEAWRYALLVYIERVFKARDGRASPLLGFLARRTLNHVASCRRASMLQKQLLLPVFLGGCETADEDLRTQARGYCQWWNDKSRYDMFLTAGGLLEEIWAAEDARVWWGSVLDQKAREGGKPSVSKQYLFG